MEHKKSGLYLLFRWCRYVFFRNRFTGTTPETPNSDWISCSGMSSRSWSLSNKIPFLWFSPRWTSILRHEDIISSAWLVDWSRGHTWWIWGQIECWAVGCIKSSNRWPQPPESPPTRVATHGKQVAPFSLLLRHARGCQELILVTPGNQGGIKFDKNYVKHVKE